MSSWKEKYRRFRDWQQRPYQVAEMADEEHVCPTCATPFHGNYCPRCGQSGRIGRYSFKQALLLFIDVWGLGNRSMFRTLRDLLLRPGYMIRDYLRGMQMAYFPPFKMMFLLAALSLLVAHGWNIKGTNAISDQQQGFEQAFKEKPIVSIEYNDEEADSEEMRQTKIITEKINEKTTKFFLNLWDYYERYMSIFMLCTLVVLSVFLYIFFRKSPAIPDLRYSELLVALVYVANMLSIYSIACDFFCVPDTIEMAFHLTALIALKQFSGFSWWRTILYSLLAILLLFAAIMLLSVLFGIGMSVYLQSTMESL